MRTTSGWLPTLALVSAIGLLSAIGAGAGGDGKQPEWDQSTTYGVIVDCGSSGTRANLYHWSSDLIYPALLNDIEPLKDEKTDTPLSLKKEPGLSSMKDEPDKASEYMKEIMDFITSNIPREAQSSTGVYIMATAGMRLLDEEIQRQIMSDIAKDISTRYNFAKIKTNVISGAQEGMYQWISVNSKAKRFAPALDADKKIDGKKTFALIEMGGASIQVAYQLQADLGRKILANMPRNTGAQPAYMSQIVEPNISQETQGHKYELHSTTFLGLGSNSARDNYIDMLIKRSTRKPAERVSRFFKTKLFGGIGPSLGEKYGERKQPLVIKDPCMPLGSSEERKKPTRMLSGKETQTLGFLEEEGEEMFSVKVVGTGNYVQCHKSVSRFLRLCKKEGLHCKPEEPCTMHLLGTPFVPFDSYEFLGLGEFYYSTLSMMKLDGVYNHAEIVAKTREMCDTPIGQLEINYPEANKFDPSRSKTECFKAVFVDTFLTEGLMMPKNFGNLKTVGKIGKESVDWTLGAVLDKSLTIELAAEENEEKDEEEFDEYEEYEDEFDDFDDFDEADKAEKESREEEAEIEEALRNDDDNRIYPVKSANPKRSEHDSGEKPSYLHEQSDIEAALEMAENDNLQDGSAQEPSRSSAPESLSRSDSSLMMDYTDDEDELAELERAEGFASSLSGPDTLDSVWYGARDRYDTQRV